MNEALKIRLVTMRDKDLELRNRLLREGRLYEDYAAEMEALHISNAEELNGIIDEYGWPGVSQAGEEGASAAFVIAQHAISRPVLQMRFLAELKQAVSNGEATAIQQACLEDRILFNQGKPCRYGMLFDWDDDGNLVANVDDEERVNERRRRLGLSSLSEALEKHRREIEAEGGGPPADIQAHKRKGREWAKRVGWR